MPRSQQRLSELASFVHVPDGIVSTEWPLVAAQLQRINIGLDMWQRNAIQLALSKRADGSYAASIGGVCFSIPRQVGKTYTVGWLIFALCMAKPGMLVVWTAHHTRTSDETFDAMRTMATTGKAAAMVKTVRAANGQQTIIFHNGSRILFGAREQGFGRGFAEIDVLVFDEAQILTESALSDMVPATNAAPNGLVFLIGTPPRPKDPGEAFTIKRNSALSKDADTLWIEFSADADCNVADWDPGYVDWAQVEKANPSYPHRTSKNSILRMRKLIGSNENFKREALGIWDQAGVATRKISQELWDSTIGVPPSSGVKCYGVAFSFDGDRQSVVGVLKHEHGFHANLIGSYTGSTDDGVAGLADWLAERWRDAGLIVLSGAAGAGLLSQALLDRGVPKKIVKVLSTREYFTACQMLVEAVKDGSLTRPAGGANDALDASVAVSDEKKRGSDGAWGWQATSFDGDETPVEALSVAVWAAKMNKRVPGRKQKALV
ncbi:terminase [Arcanobacterium buesumense]|uniref:Terminase n=2 Tax=Arcanobacterium buesumense TaxID=2722751 RepID=A0A6H2ELR7_9ACTO|nr:terminase [Arcanobacterium buesumense]